MYDPDVNEIQYGRSIHMKPFGVSDATCDQITPTMKAYASRCGLGVAGGNPSYKLDAEQMFNATKRISDHDTLFRPGIEYNMLDGTVNESIEGFKNIEISRWINIVLVLLLVILIWSVVHDQ